MDAEAAGLLRHGFGFGQQSGAPVLAAPGLRDPEPVEIEPAPGELTFRPGLHRTGGVTRQDPSLGAAQTAMGSTVIGGEAAADRPAIGQGRAGTDLEREAHSTFWNQMRAWPGGMPSSRPNST